MPSWHTIKYLAGGQYNPVLAINLNTAHNGENSRGELCLMFFL